MKPIIEVNKLSKRYTDLIAVDDTSFQVHKGQCFGLLGPNGAGKTTTIEILEGIKKPTAGTILYDGKTRDKSYFQNIGVQFQTTALQDFLTVKNNLTLFQSFYKKVLPLAQLIQTCALESFIDQDTRKISGGQRQRLLLALALINDPQIIFLDEPTTGLDPQARRNFWSLIEHIKTLNKTIILTTHYMEEAYMLCDEIAIMDHGKIIAQDAPKTLLNTHFRDAIIEIPKQDFTLDPKQCHFKLLINADLIEISTDDIDTALKWLIEKNISLKNINIRARTLEDLFLELTGKTLRT